MERLFSSLKTERTERKVDTARDELNWLHLVPENRQRATGLPKHRFGPATRLNTPRESIGVAP
jgi:hypothetical protein